MVKRYTAAELEAMSAAERAEVIKAAVVTKQDEVDEIFWLVVASGWLSASRS